MADLPRPRRRPRRLRRTEALRELVRETSWEVRQLVQPIFVRDPSVPEGVSSLPGVRRLAPDRAVEEARELARLGLRAVMLFGVPAAKDAEATGAYSETGAVQEALRGIREEVPGIAAIADVCLCAYTDHGHCGIVRGRRVDNDATLEVLTRSAVSLARAGADIVAPSAMMDGQVAAIRTALDSAGFEEVAIMGYSAKHASAFYGPFREAAGSAPRFGDRRTYQMDPPNGREALREIALDVEEGADIVMVKPGLAYLDVIRAARERFDVPIAAYSVSGEYALVKAASERGWVDERAIVPEILTAMRRAGADLVITYHAKDVARWGREGSA